MTGRSRLLRLSSVSAAGASLTNGCNFRPEQGREDVESLRRRGDLVLSTTGKHREWARSWF